MTKRAQGLRTMIIAVLEDAPPNGLTSQQIAIKLGWKNRAGDPYISRVAGLLSGMHIQGLIEKVYPSVDVYTRTLRWKLKFHCYFPECDCPVDWRGKGKMPENICPKE